MESIKCKRCNDSGWIATENGYKSCECKEIERMKRILEQSGISEEFQKISIKDYQSYNKPTNEAKTAAINYIKNFDEISQGQNNSIAFLGQVGSGKTHLSIGIANTLMARGIPVRYMSYRDMLPSLKQLLIDHDNEENYQTEIRKYKSCKVLLIDDLFKGKITDSDKNIMFEIINHRYLNKQPIIISSEYTPEKLLDFDEAIGSRLIEMSRNYLIVFKGVENNYRLRGIVK